MIFANGNKKMIFSRVFLFSIRSFLLLQGIFALQCNWHSHLPHAFKSLQTKNHALWSKSNFEKSYVAPCRRRGCKSQVMSLNLVNGDIVEYWHTGKINFGFFQGSVPGKQSYSLANSNGQDEVIDIGQIISIWAPDEMSGDLPCTTGNLLNLNVEARRLLAKLPPTCLDLYELWKITRSKGKNLLLGSLDVSQWIFALRNKYGKLRIDTFISIQEGDIAYKPSSAERIAAGLVITSETNRFKRVPAKIDPSMPNKILKQGGFKAIDQSIVVSSDAKSFADIVSSTNSSLNVMSLPLENSHRQIIHSLEVFALGGSINDLPSVSRQVFKLMGVEPSVNEAQQILLKLGIWSSDERSTSTRMQKDKAVIQFSNEALLEAQSIAVERQRRVDQYTKGALKVEQPLCTPLPNGFVDLRSLPVVAYCIDTDSSRFPDDALSWNPSTNQLFIHIVNAQSYIKHKSILDEVSLMRVCTQYLTNRPLFMIPPTALHAMCFSKQFPNESVTLVVTVDPVTGVMTNPELMPTVFSPVNLLTYAEANSMISAGHSDIVSLQSVITLASKKFQIDETINTIKSPKINRRSDGKPQVSYNDDSPAHLLVKEALSLYTLVASNLCMQAGVAMPVLFGQESRVQSGRTRFGTAPLRRHIDLLAQRQILAALGRGSRLSKRQISATVHQLTTSRNQVLASNWAENAALKYDSLAVHCNQSKHITGWDYALVPSYATGRGNEVSIDGLGVLVILKGSNRTFKTGEKVLLKVYDVDVANKRVRADVE